MKDYRISEAVEKATYECMDWMENNIRDVVKDLMERNKKNQDYASKCVDFDYLNYAEGFHDALLEVLFELKIELDGAYDD